MSFFSGFVFDHGTTPGAPSWLLKEVYELDIANLNMTEKVQAVEWRGYDIGSGLS